MFYRTLHPSTDGEEDTDSFKVEDIGNTKFTGPALMLGLSFAAAYVTYTYVEEKVRHIKYHATARVLFALMASLALVALGIHSNPEGFYNNVCSKFDDVRFTPTVFGKFSDMNVSKWPLVSNVTAYKVEQALCETMSFGAWKTKVPEGDLYEGARYILNPGMDKTVVVMGDSHAKMLQYRFQRNIERRGAANSPTVINNGIYATPALRCSLRSSSSGEIPSEVMEKNMDLIRRVKPYSVIIAMKWSVYLSRGGKNGASCATEEYKTNFVVERARIIADLMSDIKYIQSLGSKVFVTGFNVEGDRYEPALMINADGSMAPSKGYAVSLSSFKRINADEIAIVENLVKETGATLIDMNDNLCWLDVCRTVDPEGNPLFKDDNHFRPFFSKYYASAVDVALGPLGTSNN